jgi:HK97 family phage prohead protease
MSGTEFLSPIAFKRAAIGEGTFEGYASTFGGEPDSHGDVIAPGAYARSLSQHKAEDTLPALLWSHDPYEPIGRFTSLVEDAHGLKVEGKLTLGTARGAAAHALMLDGALGLSIGYRSKRSEPLTGGGRLLKDVDLIEISAVALPSNRSARITSVKGHELNPRELERILREQGGLSRHQARAFVIAGRKAIAPLPSIERRADLARAIKAAAAAIRSEK